MAVAERKTLISLKTSLKSELLKTRKTLDASIFLLESSKNGNPNDNALAEQVIVLLRAVNRETGRRAPEIFLPSLPVAEVGHGETGLLESERPTSESKTCYRQDSVRSVSFRRSGNSFAGRKPSGDATRSDEVMGEMLSPRDLLAPVSYHKNDGFIDEKGGSLDLYTLHIKEINDNKIDWAENKYLGVRVFAGELSFMILAGISDLPIATDGQKEEVAKFLDGNSIKFLLDMWCRTVSQKKKRLVKGEYKDEFFRQKDEELVWIIEQKSAWFERQISDFQKEAPEVRERALWQLIEKQKKLGLVGVAAWGKLCSGNMGLAHEWAKKYHCPGLSLTDLEAFGKEGLMRAAARYDYRLGNRFSTFAVWWIRQAIARGIADTGSLIRLPVHVRDKIKKYLKSQEILTQKLGRDPNSVDWPEGEELLLPKAGTYSEIAKTQNPLSLDQPLTEEGDTLQEIVADSGDSTEQTANNTLLRERMEEVLSSLSDREKKVIKLRFGWDNCGKEMTLEEIGKELSVTRERIRQIEAKALRKLRHSTQRKKLEDLLVGLD